MKIVSIPLVALALAIFLLAPSTVSAQTALDIDEQRAADLLKFESGIPDPEKIRAIAKTTFSRPISEQEEAVLRSLAEQSNVYANLVGFIREEYDDYHRDNYSYSFVLEKVNEPLEAYVLIANEFLSIRNQAYFNLGMKARLAGKHIESLLFFRDAFRLSSFDCGKIQPRESCMRWKAEQEMQKLLGLSSVKAYVTWQ